MEHSRPYIGVSGQFSSLATISPRKEPLVKFFLSTTRKQAISKRVGVLPLILSVCTGQKCVRNFAPRLFCSRALLAAFQKTKNFMQLLGIEPYFFGRQVTVPPEISPVPQESLVPIPKVKLYVIIIQLLQACTDFVSSGPVKNMILRDC